MASLSLSSVLLLTALALLLPDSGSAQRARTPLGNLGEPSSLTSILSWGNGLVYADRERSLDSWCTTPSRSNNFNPSVILIPAITNPFSNRTRGSRANAPVMQLVGHCTTKYPSLDQDTRTSTLQCLDVGKQVQTCQGKGRKVLLELQVTLSTLDLNVENDGPLAAEFLFDMFLNPSPPADTIRPFGAGVNFDGFNINLRVPALAPQQAEWTKLVKRMRELMDGVADKKYLLTASPKCNDQENGFLTFLLKDSAALAALDVLHVDTLASPDCNYQVRNLFEAKLNSWKTFASTAGIPFTYYIPMDPANDVGGWVSPSIALNNSLGPYLRSSGASGVIMFEASNLDTMPSGDPCPGPSGAPASSKLSYADLWTRMLAQNANLTDISIACLGRDNSNGKAPEPSPYIPPSASASPSVSPSKPPPTVSEQQCKQQGCTSVYCRATYPTVCGSDSDAGMGALGFSSFATAFTSAAAIAGMLV